jgi:hypothetical protein
MNKMLSQRNKTKCWIKNKKGKRVHAQCIKENNCRRKKKNTKGTASVVKMEVGSITTV